MITILWIIGGLVLVFIFAVLLVVLILNNQSGDSLISYDKTEVDVTDYSNEIEDNYRF